jgi:hypothetical protein
MGRDASFKSQFQKRSQISPRPKPKEERPTSPFEKRTYIKREEVRRWASRDYGVLKEIWRGYKEKRDKVLNEFFEKYWGKERSYLTKKDYQRIKKQLEKEEKWAPWPRKKQIREMKKFLEKFEKDFPA